MDDAIAGHRGLVDEQAHRLRHRGDVDWDDVVSDGMLALWQALDVYNPSLGDVRRFLRIRIRHRMIDGLRRRAGRQLGHVEVVSVPDVSDELLPPDQSDLTARIGLADTVLSFAPIDPRLPGIAALIAAGYTQTEVAATNGMSRQRTQQLLHRAIPQLPRTAA